LPSLKATGLWAKTSSGGKRYLIGRLGGVKVLILANRDSRSDDDPTYHLFFVEMPDRRQAGSGAQRQTDERNAVPAAQPQASSSRQPAPPAAAGVLQFLYKPKHENHKKLP
jgi:hypothetical protein